MKIEVIDLEETQKHYEKVGVEEFIKDFSRISAYALIISLMALGLVFVGIGFQVEGLMRTTLHTCGMVTTFLGILFVAIHSYSEEVTWKSWKHTQQDEQQKQEDRR